MNYVISCESTVDMPYTFCKENELEIIFYSFVMNDRIYQDNMYREPLFDDSFYAALHKWNSLPKASVLSLYTYQEHFRRILEQGKEIIHVCTSSKVSKSYYHALAAAETLRREFPSQRIAIIDSTCASFSYGMLIDDACEIKNEGKDFFELEDFIERNKYNYHSEFFVNSVKYLVHTKRIEKKFANLVSLLHIKLLNRINEEGRVVKFNTKQTVEQCLNELVENMKNNCKFGENYNDKIIIGYGDTPEIAHRLFEKVKNTFPNVNQKIKIRRQGNVTASVTGPKIISLTYKGRRRQK